MQMKDVLAGAFFVAIGGIGAVLSSSLPIGTARAMSAGYIPQVLSWLLIAIGAGIATKGLLSRERVPLTSFSLRPLFFVGCALAVFAATVDILGLLIATGGVVIIGALASPESRAMETAGLAIALAAGSWLLFVVALGVPFKVFL